MLNLIPEEFLFLIGSQHPQRSVWSSGVLESLDIVED